MIFKKNTLFAIGLLIKRLVCLARARFFARAFTVFLVLVVTSFVVLTAVVNIGDNRVNKAYAATSSTINFQARLLNSSGNVVPDGNYHIEFKLYNANNTTGSSQGSCSGDSNCLWTETRTTGNLVRVVNGYLTVNLGSVTAFPSTINWDQEHWLGMRIGGSSGSAAWETIEMTSDGTATGGKLKLTAVPYALRAGGLQSTSGANALKLNLATPTANVTYTLQDAAAGNYDLCTTATVCTGYAPSSGGSTYIQNTTSLQSAANFNIQSAASGSVGGVIRGATSQTADLFQLQDSSGVILTAFNASGQLVFGPSGSQDTNLYRSAANTLKTDDDFAVGSNLTISASGNITQTGATTISTGTGAISLNGATSVTGTNTLTVGTGATSLGGSLGVSGNTILSGSQFTNNGSTLYTAIAITDKPAGGNIGTAATTVDVATTFNVNQTTASQTLTLPNPTSATSGRIAYVNNVGSAGFTMGGLTISASSSGTFIWNGSTWVAGNVSSGVASVGAIDSQTKSANGAVISGSTIYLQNADATYPGLVSATTQTFAGAKTFNGNLIANATALFQNASNSTTAFQIQNASAQTLFVADTTNQRVAIGPAAVPANGVLTIGTDTTTASGGLYFGTDTNLYRSAANTLKTDDNFTVGDGASSRNLVIQGNSWNGTVAIVNSDTGSPYNLFYRSRGSLGAETATISGDALGNLGFRGYSGSSYLNQDGARIAAVAEETFTASSQATRLSFYTAPTGSISPTERLRISSTGNIGLGTTSTTAGLVNIGTNTTASSSGLYFGTDTNLYRSAANTLKTDDDFAVGSNVTISASGNITQTGATTLSTGTGAISLNGDTTIANGKAFTVGTGSQFTNGSSTVNTTYAVPDDANGGSLNGGVAASASVDIYTSISIAQTTASQTITLPTPTASTTYGRLLYVSNVGTTSFTLLGSTLTAGSSATLVWSNTNGGASWQYAGAVPFSTGNFIQNGTSPQTADFNIAGTATIVGTTLINTTGTANTSIGNATGTLTLTGSSSSTIVLNGVTISATELNYLDGHDAALVDTNDAVNTAITGTGALTTGSIASGFGTIATANTITGTTLNGTTGINTGAGAGTQRIDATGNLLNIGNVTTSGASTFSTTGATGFTFKPGTDNTSAFQLQNAAGVGLFVADTSNMILRPGVVAAFSSFTQATTTVDNTASIGAYSSIAIGTDGLPVVAYYDSTNTALVVTKCGNSACSSGNVTNQVDNTAVVGTHSSIAIGTDGLPIVSYYDATNTALRVTKCGNSACSSGNTSTEVDNTASVGTYSSIAIGTDGLPIISYYDSDNTALRVTKCGNSACSSGNTSTEVDNSLVGAGKTSIGIGSDGLPIISYYYDNGIFSQYALNVVKCGNSACSSGNTVTQLDDDDASGNVVGTFSSLAIGPDGLAVISYKQASDGNLRVAKCGNSLCDEFDISEIETTNDIGSYTSIAIGTDGLPIISYYDTTNTALRVTKCGNSACSSGNTATEVDNSANVGGFSSMSIGSDGLPVISHYDTTNTSLIVTKCANSACSSSSGSAYGGGTSLGSIASSYQSVYFDTLNLGREDAKVSLDQNGTFRVNALTSRSDGTINFGVSNSTNAFKIQNAGGSTLFNLDSVDNTNLIENRDFELGTLGWAALGSSTLTQDTTQKLYGSGSMKVDSSAAGDGVKYSYQLASSTSYVFSIYVKSSSSYLKERIEIGRADDGSTNTACSTVSNTTDNVSNGWTRYFCKFTTGTISGSPPYPYVYIKHNTSSLDFFVDGAQLEQTTSSEPSPYSFGKLTLNAQIASPLYIQPTQNSSSVFQIQNTASETLLNVASDTFNMLDNSSFENGSASPWVAIGAASVSSASGYTKFIGDRSLKIDTSLSAGDGAKYPIALESNTTYIFSFYSDTNMQASTEVGYSNNGSTDNPCMRSPYSPGAERFMCQFTTGTVSGSPYIYIKTTAGTGVDYYIDGVQLQKLTAATASYWYAPDDFESDTTPGFWGLLGTETIGWSTAQSYSPTHSMSVDTPASANAGIYVYGALESYKQYHVSFRARLASGTFNTFQFGYHDGDTTYTNCATGQTVSTGSWTKFDCFFNTGAMPYGWNGSIYWRQSDATARTFYIDDLTIITQDEDALLDTPYTGNVRLSVGKPAIDSKYTLDVAGSLGVDGYIYVSGTRFNSTHLSDTQDLARLSATQTFNGDNTFAGTSTIVQAGTDTTQSFLVKNVAGTTLFGVNTSGKTINIGSTGSTNSASTVNISNTSNSATAQVVNIGSTAPNVSNITTIQGGANTTQAIQLVPNAAGGIMIGATAGTGTITLGRSTATNTISIGSGNPSTATQTINIGNGTMSGGSTTNVNILSGSAASSGTATLNLGDSDRVTQIDIGNVVADAARTINMGTGNSTAVDTLNIGTGNTTVAGGKTIHIGDGTPTGSGTNLITIGTLTNASTTTILGGTGSDAVSIQAANAATILMGTTTTANTSIGNATGTLTLTGSSSSTIVLNGVTISATELNYLDGHDAALVDTNDAVNTAITGTGALTTGSIASGFGTISTANNITTSANISTTGTGTITSAGLLTGQAGLTVSGATISLNDSSNFATNINTGTSTGAVSVGNGSAGAVAIQSGSTVGITSGTSLTLTSGGSSNIVLNSAGLIDLQDNVDVTGSTAFKRGTDFSTTGTNNNVNFGEVSLVRLTGASAQTITGIANGRDGEILTIVNAAGQSATISNNSGSSSSGNQIITGTGANITLPSGGSITLVYDAASPGYWRVVGNVAFSTGNYIQNGTTQQTSANFNIQSASAGSVGAVIQGATSQTADILQLKDESGDNLLSVGANAGFAVQSSNGFTSTSAFTVGIAGGATIFRVNSTTPGIHTGSTTFGVFNDTATTINAFGAANTINMGAAGASIINPGSLSLQATGTNTLTLNTTGAGTVNLGTTNTTTVGIGNTTAATAVTIQGGTGASALSLQAGSGGTINVGTLSNNNVAINTAAVAGTTTIGGTGTTGTITLGQSTATNTINIGANVGASATQTINIGTSATASSTTNVNVGSAIGTSATNIRAGTSGVTVYQSATSATALKIQNAASESLFTAGDDGGGSSIRLDNAYLYLAGVPTPVSPTLSSSGTGGSLTANTYYYRVSSYDSTGLVSTAIATSPASATTTGSSSRNTISWTQVSGATGYAVDRSTNGGVTWYRNDVGNVASIIDNGVTYTWSGSDYGSHGRINYSASVTLQSGGAVFLDTTGDVSLNKNNATGDIELTNLGSGGGINLTGSDFQYTDNTSFENLFTISSTGDATFRTQTGSNSATAFQIQNATGADTMFTVDNSTTNKVKIGNSTGTGTSTTVFQLDAAASAPFSTGQTAYLGSMYYDTTQGKLQCYEDRNGTATWGACGSAPNNIVTLTPEYTGAVLNGTGTGTMTADFCSNESGVLTVGSLCANHEARNFYKWTSPQSTDQTYSIYVTYKLPSTFNSFDSSSTIKLTALSDNTTNASATLQVFRKNVSGNTISSCGSATTINNTANTWQQTSFGGDETACGFAGGDYVIFKINVTAKSSGNIYVENLDFTFRNN